MMKIKQIQGLQTELNAKASNDDVVTKSSALAGLNYAAARSNLNVYSRTEIDAMIAGVDNSFSAATIRDRDELLNLRVADRVFVADDGDGRWALYVVESIGDPNNGSTATWVKIADPDLFGSSMTATEIKSSYESNADTNEFDDAAKSKVDKITITDPANINDMIRDIASASDTARNANTAARNAQTTANNAMTTASAAGDPIPTTNIDNRQSTGNVRAIEFQPSRATMKIICEGVTYTIGVSSISTR